MSALLSVIAAIYGLSLAVAAGGGVLLTVSPRVVASRIAGTDRPLLSGEEDPVARWQRILAERMPLYEQVADVTFDTSSGPLSDIVTAIVAWARRTERPASGSAGTDQSAKEQG